MHRNTAKVVLVAAVCLLVVAPSSFAERKRLEKPSQRQFEVEPAQLMLAAHLPFGYLVGEAGDIIDRFGSSKADKMIFAGAASLEYLPKEHWSVHGTLERAWWHLGEDAHTVTGWSLGAGLQYKLVGAGKRSPFLRVEAGRIWASADGYEYEAETYWRAGVGLFEYTTPTTNLRLELFYRTLLAEEAAEGYNVEYIGVDFGVGFNL